MLESFFVQEHVLFRLRTGPVGPHLPDLAAQLTQQHYARRTGCILLRTADRFGRWLAQEGVALADATPVHLESFAASEGRRDTGRLPQMVGCRAGEVRQLRLQDIDWAEGVLHVRQGKSRRERCLPLPADAGALAPMPRAGIWRHFHPAKRWARAMSNGLPRCT
jgi:integrase